MATQASRVAIGDLPQELLFHIFSLLFAPPLTVQKGRKIWEIARVCRRWMSLVLSTEHWWSDVVLTKPDFGSATMTVPINFLERCILYSGNRELSLAISTNRGINTDFVGTLQKGSTRLRQLKVEVLTGFVRVFEESKTTIRAPNLEHLDVAQLDGVFVDVSDFLAGIQLSPSLSSFSMRRLALLSVPNSPTNFPWQSLTYLALSIHTSDAVLVELLAKTINLASLRLIGTYIERHAPWHMAVLEKLSELTVDTYTSSYLASTFNSLHVPNLRKVHYLYGEFSVYKQLMLESLFEQAPHFRATVVEVIVEDVDIALGLQVAALFPNVRELTIEDIRPWSQRGKSMRNSSSDPSYDYCLARLPFLRTLCLMNGSILVEDLKFVLSLVTARNEAVKHGRGIITASDRPAKVTLHLPVLSGMEDAGYISAIKESGLTIGTDIIL